MNALLLKADFGDNPFFCLSFPDIGLFSESGRDGQVYFSTDNRAEFWSDKPLVTILEVPFDVVARLYCSVMNFRIDEFKRADYELWDEHGKAAVTRAMRSNFKTVSK